MLICYSCRQKCSAIGYHDGIGAGHKGSEYFNDDHLELGSHCCNGTVVYFPDDKTELEDMLCSSEVKSIDEFLNKYSPYDFSSWQEAGKEGVI